MNESYPRTALRPPARPSRSRRAALFAIAAVSAGAVAPRWAAGTETSAVEVWKSPSCGCCTDWVEHLRSTGFQVTVHDTGNTAARSRLGLPEKFWSCHTGLVGGYVVEGHVPADEIRRLLAQRPQALGLAVPGMPLGSPGMEMGDQRDPFDVLLVQRDGSSRVWRSYR